MNSNMNFDNFTKPTLTEPGVKYFLNETLKQCNEFKVKYNNTIFNISLFAAFLFILACLLIYKYKGKLTPNEQRVINNEKQQYILSKIKIFQENKTRAQNDLITGLPDWENEYDIIHAKVR